MFANKLQMGHCRNHLLELDEPKEQVAVHELINQQQGASHEITNMSNRYLLERLIRSSETLCNVASNWLSLAKLKYLLTCASAAATAAAAGTGGGDRRKTNASAGISSKKPSLIVSIILPLLFVFLLPTFKLEHQNNQNNLLHSPEITSSRTQFITSPEADKNWPAFTELLIPLMRFPIDRLRLVSSGLGFVAAAKELQSDLQEEETHMQMMQPAEHRGGAYLSQSSGPQQQQQQQATGSGYQQVLRAPPQRILEIGHGAGYQPSTENVRTIPGDQQPAGDYAPNQAAGDGATAGEQTGGMEVGTATISDSPGQTSLSSNGLQTRSDLPAVRALNVKCEKNHMMVNLVFDRPFYGMVFSKGHYNDQKCIHLPASSGQTSVNFDIHLGRCGMTSSDANGNPNAMALHQQQLANNGQQQPHGLYIENTIIIQYDPQVQEIYDQARKLRCTWYDYYEKSVSFKPYNVDMLDAVTANFLGDNIQCWMQIQVGKGPWSSEVAGIVKIGQTMTMVLAIKDDENRFDMLVRNCVAHDGKHGPIQLVDEYGCVARPKIMAKFQKVKNFGPAATVVSYAHFQAFKFPDSMSVHFQCVIQVCRYECPEPVCTGPSGGSLPGQLGADMSGGGGQPPADYTASGTEIVSSKEPVANYFLANHSAAPSSSSQGSTVNLKLDESQGRVQVKLDTSMMAGLGQHQQNAFRAHQNGPYPPHLLHLAAGSSSAESRPVGGVVAPAGRGGGGGGGGGHTFISSSYQNKPVSTSGQHMTQTIVASSTSSRPQLAVVTYGGRPAQVAPSSHSALHYSSPYHQRTAYATNRLGEQASAAPGNTLEMDIPLSLIASPRALQSAQVTPKLAPSNHRYRRSLSAQNNTASLPPPIVPTSSRPQDRRERDLQQESTAIKTQKTIQVVSPDDVAFSLLDDDLELDPLAIVTGTPYRRPVQQVSKTAAYDHLSTVCFSAAKLVFAILVTLATLAVSVVIVAFIILRQRSKLEAAKLSNIYEGANDQVSSSLSLLSGESAEFQQPQQQQQLGQHQQTLRLDGRPELMLHRQVDYPGQRQKLAKPQHHKRHCSPTSASRHDDELMASRQSEEIQQRNKCLARLYSQFVPAAYWR